MPDTRAISVELLDPGEGDLVAMAQCMAIDADAFPYPSAHFGMRSSSSLVWVARFAAERTWPRVVGFLAGTVRGAVLHVEGIAVDRAARRQGVARVLVREAASEARRLRLRAITLHVGVDNAAAVALYEGEGFSLRRLLAGFYPAAAFDGQRDAYEMVLRLPRTG
jgi:ribosomal protein S18 acetylase RimI-like enzyme